jgi:hypothetical protein
MFKKKISYIGLILGIGIFVSCQKAEKKSIQTGQQNLLFRRVTEGYC